MSAAILTRRARPLRHVLPRLGLLVLLVVAAWLVARPLFHAYGEVSDAQTGAPLVGALARSPGEAVRTGPNGSFQLGLVAPWETITFEADGYEPRSVALHLLPGPTSIALPPLTAEVWTLDAETGRFLPTVLDSDGGRLEPLEAGRFRLAPARTGTTVTARADGYFPASAEYRGQPLQLRLTPVRAGRVLDATTGRPIPRALLLVDEQLVQPDADGRFELKARPSQRLRVFAPGYRRLEVDAAAPGPLELRLEPFAVRGLYLTFYGVGSDDLRANVLNLLETTEANALVIDVKGDRGYLAYASQVPLAARIGANRQPTFPEMRQLLADLHARGYYAIARIVIMKDDLLARNGGAAGLDVAIKDRRTGGPWVDGEGLGWVDPFRQEVRDYNTDLAVEAADLGFDEVQFDYVRFPTDPSSATSVNAAVYSQELTEDNRVAAIASLLEQTHTALRSRGVFFGIDTFGYTSFRDDDLGIGQRLATLAAQVDVISPMVYPSTYNAGIPSLDLAYPGVIGRPYDVIHESLLQAQQRVGGTGAILRPWLQYFDDYPWATGRRYNAAEIEAQKQGAADGGAQGWMMWDPFNQYARGGLGSR